MAKKQCLERRSKYEKILFRKKVDRKKWSSSEEAWLEGFYQGRGQFYRLLATPWQAAAATAAASGRSLSPLSLLASPQNHFSVRRCVWSLLRTSASRRRAAQ